MELNVVCFLVVFVCLKTKTKKIAKPTTFFFFCFVLRTFPRPGQGGTKNGRLVWPVQPCSSLHHTLSKPRANATANCAPEALRKPSAGLRCAKVRGALGGGCPNIYIYIYIYMCVCLENAWRHMLMMHYLRS